MKFESKAHMAQELMAGKRFTTKQLDGETVTVFYDEATEGASPFTIKYDDVECAMSSEWDSFCLDIWTEVEPEPETKTVYEWMFKPTSSNTWVIEPVLMTEKEAAEWFEVEYRKTGRSWEIEG